MILSSNVLEKRAECKTNKSVANYRLIVSGPPMLQFRLSKQDCLRGVRRYESLILTRDDGPAGL